MARIWQPKENEVQKSQLVYFQVDVCTFRTVIPEFQSYLQRDLKTDTLLDEFPGAFFNTITDATLDMRRRSRVVYGLGASPENRVVRIASDIFWVDVIVWKVTIPAGMTYNDGCQYTELARSTIGAFKHLSTAAAMAQERSEM